MIISEKQIMQLMEYCRELAENSLMAVTPRKAINLLKIIRKQQSDELKVVE